jgi:hypothetical protein
MAANRTFRFFHVMCYEQYTIVLLTSRDITRHLGRHGQGVMRTE